jgi:hypothetical protein
MDRYVIMGTRGEPGHQLTDVLGGENDLDTAKRLAESHIGSDDMSWIQMSEITWILMSRGINTGIVIHQRPDRKGNAS